MARVISFLPRERFDQAEVKIPTDIDMDFSNRYQEQEIIETCKNAEIIYCPSTFPNITRAILLNLPLLKFIQVSGTGYDKIDVRAATELNIPVANSPGINSVAVAEHVFALITNLQRHILFVDREIKNGRYLEVRKEVLEKGVLEINKRTVAIVGMGSIGREVARLMGYFGAKVVYYSRHRLNINDERRLNLKYFQFDELINVSDIITLHLPLSEKTRYLIDQRELDLMKPGAILINTARGGLVNEKALARALEKGHIGGAAVDTFFEEPPAANNPLLCLSQRARQRVIFTPHLAGVAKQSFARMLVQSLDNVKKYIIEGKPDFVVNGAEIHSAN